MKLRKVKMKKKYRNIKTVDEEMKKRIIQAMYKTWNYIGCDLISETGDLSQSEVIEVVLDADRVTTFGSDKEAAKVLYELSYNAMKTLAKEAFPFKRYGM